MIDHMTAERTMAVERYLLDELPPDEKEEFEEHFFSCDECAREMKAGAVFMEQAKEGLRDDLKTRGEALSAPESAARRPKQAPRRSWFAWLSPAIAAPAMAFMLGLLAFQNLIQLPALHRSAVALNAPALLPGADLKSGSSRGGESTVDAKSGALFQLTIDIPDTAPAAHIAELYDSSGRKLFSLAIPQDATREGLALKMPGDLPAGKYSLFVKQAGASTAEISRYDFQLKRD